jgi:uncharacterized protein (DUF885 family)
MRELDRLCESYGDLLQHLDPAAANAAGFVSGVTHLGRFDREAVREHAAALRATASAIEELEVEALADEIDRTALLDDVRISLAQLEEDRAPVRNPHFWIDHLARTLASFLHPWNGRPVGSDGTDGLADCMARIPSFLDTARTALRRPFHPLIDAALAQLGGVGELLVHAATAVAERAPSPGKRSEENDASAAVVAPDGINALVTEALRSLTAFGHWLRSDVEPEPLLANAVLGAARFERRIHHRHSVREGPAELWRYAGHLLEDTEAALIAEAHGAEWRELVRTARETTVAAAPTISTELERVRNLVGEAGITVPAGPEVVVAPPHLRALVADATYVPSTSSSARLVLPAVQLSRGAASAIAAAALAGRHVQESSARSLASIVRQTLRAPIAVRGWALYAEEWMAERGLYVDAESRLFRLLHLLRAAGRLAVDVGLHARAMPLDDAMTLLIERAGFTPEGAQGELRHCLAHPTDGAAAALGRREILALKAKAGVPSGDAPALHRFHAELLQYGALPSGLAGWGLGLAG